MEPVAVTISNGSTSKVLVGLMDENMISVLVGEALTNYAGDDFIVLDAIEDGGYVNRINFILDHQVNRIEYGQVWIKVKNIVGFQELDVT